MATMSCLVMLGGKPIGGGMHILFLLRRILVLDLEMRVV